MGDKEPSALIDVDLARIKFVEQNAILAGHHDLYLKALQDLQSNYPADPHSALVAYEIALEYLRRGGEYNPPKSDTNRWAIKSAKETCDKTIGSFPGSDGAQNCAILLKQITGPSLTFIVNYANVPDQPFLGSLTFKNIKSVYFRIIKINPDEDRNLRQLQTGVDLITKYMTYAPVKEWTLKLPDEGDFQAHSTQIKLPGLPKGYYVILASDNPNFSVDDKSVAYAPCWITGISYISRNSQPESKMEVYVLDRDKGTPLKGVEVRTFVREYDYQSRSYVNKPVDSYISDDDGYFTLTGQVNASKSFYIELQLGDDLFFTENYFYLYPPHPEEKSRLTTYFFTDRSIYRPGQIIYFKGIVLEKTGGKSAIKPDFSTVVTFFDANNQKVSEKALTTNAFGSFNGTFIIPSGGLTGEMSIRNESGNTNFSVEEYKRPRFKVELDSLEGSYKLNEVVNVTGKAENYNGSAVDQAEVAYRVVRTARFPVWRSWWNWFPAIRETEITSGKTVTDTEGAFKLSFTAIPDLQVDKKYEPVFNYTVYVDVTDLTGEVRSKQESISIGYKSMLMDISIPENLNIRDKNAFRFSVTNLSGRPLKVTGRITVYPLDAPARLIRQRTWGRPDVFVMSREEFLKDFPNDLYDNENDPDTWKMKPLLLDKTFNSGQDSVFTIENLAGLAEGEYVVLMEATDASGDKVVVKKYFTAFNPNDKQMPAYKPFWHVMMKNSGEPGDTASFIVGTAEKNVKLLYEIENDGKMISRKWLPLDQDKIKLDIPIVEEYRGNFFVSLVFIKGNRSYETTEKISVPFTDKELKITTETFRDKLTPGQEEEWKLRITGMKGEKVAAEVLASMYDASLDAFREHQWNFELYPYRSNAGGWDIVDAFTQANSHFVTLKPQLDMTPVIQSYDQLNWFGFNYYGAPYPRLGGMQMRMNNAVPEMDGKVATKAEEVPATAPAQEKTEAATTEPSKAPDMPVRRNFNETAFFFPALMTDETGDVILKFTMPESLTAWKLMALAYTKDLKTGQLEKEIVTRKDLMVMANAPRFFREGDQILFTAKVVSLSDQKLQGQVQAEFFDAYTMKPIDSLLGNQVKTRDLTVEKGKSGVFSWDISIPDGLDAIVCRVKATAGDAGDGEEIVVPVLPNRMLVTETFPLPVNGKGTDNFKFTRLAESAKSNTIMNYRLTLEFTSNPAWYAVQALPYLVENPHESSDGLFSRYYANTLASFIANSNPKIKQVFENWKNLSPDAFLSNLEKNQDLKAVLLAETPWVLEARNQSEQKKNIALLFDLNRMAGEQQSSMKMLGQMQSPNGGWSWFEGMPDNRYITQLIVTGFGRLRHLRVIDLKKDQVSMNMIRRAFSYLDGRIKEDYDDLLEHNKDKMDENHLTSTQVQYLYAYSYFVDLFQVSKSSQEAFDYFKGQAARYWIDQDKYLQGMIALTLIPVQCTGGTCRNHRLLKRKFVVIR